ncbi:MAG: NAD(P)-dependent oxidoreductase [Candidatus Scalindua sp.]|nr:NAD(P)-dependent oxidoreductase [Candidatus Scalindua sp.]
MKIAITGLSGFLGHFVAEKLFKRGVRMRALVRDTSNIVHLKDFGEKVTYIKGDLADREVVNECVKGSDIVIHMAYERNGTGFRDAAKQDYDKLLKVNLLGSLELLNASKEQGVKQFIFVSSCAVYGYIFPGIRLDEQHPLIPDSHYGAYKASVEAFCHAFFMTKSMHTTIFRPVGIYGVDPDLPQSEWYGLIKDIKRGTDVEVSGGGKVVHVEDVAKAVDLAVGNKEASGKIYNLSDFYIDNLSVAQIAGKVCASGSKIMGTPKKPINTIDNSQSQLLGVNYRGTEGIRRYIQELIKLI